MRATWMADALRAGGCAVDETRVPDWRARGHGEFAAITHIVGHHTAGASTGDYPSLGIVRDGRPGLDGPLANLGLTRSGVWVPIASGVAWHAGAGSYPGLPANNANYYALGVEAESVGSRDDWTPQQRISYPKGVAALLKRMGQPASHFIGHKEWAPTRKVDPGFWDMNVFRAAVSLNLAGAPAPEPEPPAPPVQPKEDTVMFLIRNSKGVVVLLSDTFAEWVPTADDHRNLMGKLGTHVQLSDGLFDRLVHAARAGSENTSAIMKDLADEEPTPE